MIEAEPQQPQDCKPTERQLLDIELARLSFADLQALRDYTWNRPGNEWRALCSEVSERLAERAGKYLLHYRLVQAEEAEKAR